jgi:hypothetical protein
MDSVAKIDNEDTQGTSLRTAFSAPLLYVDGYSNVLNPSLRVRAKTQTFPLFDLDRQALSEKAQTVKIAPTQITPVRTPPPSRMAEQGQQSSRLRPILTGL